MTEIATAASCSIFFFAKQWLRQFQNRRKTSGIETYGLYYRRESMVHPNSNNIINAQTDIKLVGMRKKLWNLKRQLRSIAPYSFEEKLPKIRRARQGYVSAKDLMEGIQLVEEEISVV